MDFKLVSKNNMGIVVTLILVILLSQSKFFNFLIDTGLGRSVLILFILVISYVNKILGAVAVLFIIIIFNQSNIGYMEGFTANKNSSVDKKQHKLNNLKVKNKSAVSNASTNSPESFSGREGFNTVDRESTMLRGKRSSEVHMLSNARTQNEDV